MDLLEASLVSKKWKKLSNSNGLWQRLFTKHNWTIPKLQNKENDDASSLSYKDIYLKTRTPVHIGDWLTRKKKSIIPLSPVDSSSSFPSSNSTVKFKRKRKHIHVLLMGLIGIFLKIDFG